MEALAKDGDSGSSNSGKGSSSSGSSNSGTTSISGKGSSSSGSGSATSTVAESPNSTEPDRAVPDNESPTSLAVAVQKPVVSVTPPVVTAPPQATSKPEVPTPNSPADPSSSPVQTRVMRSNKCGSRTLVVEIRVDDEELRVRTRISPRSAATWNATVIHERRVVWRGSARRGEVDHRLTNLSGSEVVTVRLANGSGTICAAEVVVRG